MLILALPVRKPRDMLSHIEAHIVENNWSRCSIIKARTLIFQQYPVRLEKAGITDIFEHYPCERYITAHGF